MEVQLPTTGCNIINNASSFYNYSTDAKTRETYYIYEGVAHLQNSSYNQYGYTYSGTCLQTGDLVYKPELLVYYPVISTLFFLLILTIIYHVILKRLLP